MPLLSPAQRAAVAFVAGQSSGRPLDRSLRVTFSFHPDRGPRGATVLDALARDGVYRSQFETGTSNGGLTAHPGGARWSWESRLFGGAYDGEPASARPTYGALDFRRRGAGGSPRFGSAHLRLAEPVLDRSTFCFPDSALEPFDVAVAGRCSLVELARGSDLDELDDYVEAHVHGPVRVAHDVEALVLDPCFRGTAVEAAARALPCPLEWHAGLVLGTEELRRHVAYRGPEVVDLGVRIAREGRLDARVVGEEVARGVHDPLLLKRVWHHVARFGGPAA